ncbi:MAG: MoxR family ATPase [Candidatus Firestonebacteria bacterium]|nr:MoxR family ATPase [Candidatus Firestonebacteria bacterium]
MADSKELTKNDIACVEDIKSAHARVKTELAKVIVGQDKVIDELLICIFARGHVLLEGVPGLAKTLLISTLSRVLSIKFNRIQFTPDLMPSDITGTEVISEDKITKEREFRFLQGPIFSNIVLADEINRAPPKTQAALLEAMQEHKVSVGGKSYTLQEPFFVLATQNPVEQEGTYPLPEAQLDRFMFKAQVDYPSAEEEVKVMRNTTSGEKPKLNPVLTGEQIIAFQDIVRKVPIADHVIKYAYNIVRSTRPIGEKIPDFIKEYVSWGAGPRAGQYLLLGGKARAILMGQPYVSCDDIEAVAYAVLRHRILLNFTAESEGITTDEIIKRILTSISKTTK